MAFTSFPIETKKITELVETTSIDGTEQLAVVDGGVSSRVTVDNLITPFKPINTVLVNSEADLPPVDGSGQHPLADLTNYVFGAGQIILTAGLKLPPNAQVSIEGQGYGISQIIFIGSGQEFLSSPDRLTNLVIHRITPTDGVGNNTLFNLKSHPTSGTLGAIVISDCTFRGWGLKGRYETLNECSMVNTSFFQCGKLILDRVSAWSASTFVSKNFVATGAPHFEILGSLSQCNINASAFLPAKGETALNIDPAVDPQQTGISIGSSVPFNGLVTAGIVQYVDIGSGQVRVVCGGGHSFENGDSVLQQASTNYNGVFTISNVVNIDPTFTFGTYDITATFVADDAQGEVILLDGANPRIENFFLPGLTGSITAYANNGSGGTTVTSASHGLSNGQTLFISGDAENDYDGGYTIFNVTTNTFDIATPFVADDAQGTWNTGSLDQTNNSVEVVNAGGIVPDSQALGNNILTSTVAFASTTTLTRVSTGTWLADEEERFKATSDGRLIYTGKTPATVSLSAKAVVQRQSGTTATAFMNIMEKRVGAGSFTEITNHPSSQTQITSSDASQLTVAAIVDSASPGDEFGIGIASDSSLAMDIFSIDFNIKK